MRIVSDNRRLRIRQLSVVDGEIKCSSAGDAWQDEEGVVHVTGLWDGIVPLTPEDMMIRASRIGLSPLEWFRKRLFLSPTVDVEVF